MHTATDVARSSLYCCDIVTHFQTSVLEVDSYFKNHHNIVIISISHTGNSKLLLITTMYIFIEFNMIMK